MQNMLLKCTFSSKYDAHKNNALMFLNNKKMPSMFINQNMFFIKNNATVFFNNKRMPSMFINLLLYLLSGQHISSAFSFHELLVL